MSAITEVSSNKMFKGLQKVYSHERYVGCIFRKHAFCSLEKKTGASCSKYR